MTRLTRRTMLAQATALCALPAFGQSRDRLLTIGGSVTEIVHALGAGDRLVARDTTSTYPPEVTDLPDVGYARALSPEGVLSVAPDHILAIEGAGPPETINVLKASGLPFTTVPEASDGPGILEKIAVVGQALGLPDRAETLIAETRAALDATARMTAQIAPGESRRVLFILSLQGGRILAGGTGTQAAGIIEMAGAVNAVDAFEGYKQLTDEAVSSSAPDVILMMDRGGDHAIEDEVLLSMPAIRTTPAAETGAVIRMQGLYLLGFGPRTAQAARDLHSAIYATTQPDDDTDPS
ncbi:MAG: ABC transporter substrate-binding protein [Roseovarius sp.]|jgi:iron complex transport system substrate-binding protein|uniref:heme/hemin ABC transporter substrate-binding protein n=1 Tax=Roseovarius sp. TaxID=1486281 RepID=UPI0032ECE6B0